VSVVVFIGLILLVGIVVKNAIILIDKVNQLREDGVAKREALVEGARSRLRPIMMTTLCALFGFLPLALGLRRRRGSALADGDHGDRRPCWSRPC
jgi:HAE1 family hydrophobic/amphiphilic exporter-1